MRARISVMLGIACLLGCAPALRQSPAVTSPPAAASDGPVTAEIDSIASAFLREGNLAGFSVGVLRGDEILFDRGYGWADLENRVPADAGTVYRIGSLTKTMTATAVMQLAERGLLDPDDPIGRFFPDYPAPARDVVTIHHLLSMTSGIPNYTMDPRLDYFRERLPHDSVVALFRDRPLLFAPGEGYDYSNSNYYLLGLLIEKLSGTSYDQYVQEHIVAPLGSASFARMAAKTVLNSGAESGYGYGLAVDELRGHRQLSHAGNLDGFQSSISYFPEDSLAVVVLANTESSGAADLKERIARHLLDIRPLTLADVADLPLTAGERERYLATYALETMPVTLTVSEADGRLQLSMAGQTPMALLYQGDHRFVLADDLETSLEFTLEGGLATRVLVRSATGNLFRGTRVP